MANLFETILSALPANTGDVLGAHLGESPDAAFKGLSGIIPLLLGALAGKSATSGGLGSLLSLVQGGLAGGNPLDNPAALLGDASSAGGLGNLASQLLGSNMAPLAAAVASYFGLKGSSVNALLSMAGPLVAGGIGKVLGASPSAEGLSGLLASEKDSYSSALPPELRRLIAPPAAAASTPAVTETATPGTWKWLLLGLVILGLLGWLFFGRGHKEAPAPVPAETAAVEVAPVVAPVVAPPGAGVASEERAGLPVLIVFFDVAKSDVTNDLAAESAAVKAYVDSHPDARVSVSGFNDPTGDAAANAALSKTRAEKVKAALTDAGVAADRIDLDKPASATDTSESYAGARRVEVTIKE